jgi:hypothetical protein
MSYLKPLPDNCPPAESEEITAERVVYRLVSANPPKLEDFRSQRAQRPEAVFLGVSECLTRGLSVHTEQSDSEKMRKLPRFRGSLVCRIRLANGAGQIQQTFQPSHHTWWPLAAFEILSHCRVLT